MSTADATAMVSYGAAEIVSGLMPALRADLAALARIPSISVPGRIDEALLEAHDMVARLFADAGVDVGRLDLPDTAPVVVGHIAAPPGAPTVALQPLRRRTGR